MLTSAILQSLPSFSDQARCSFNGRQLTFSQLGSLAYDSSILFDAESCTLERGFVYGIVGPNGTGKSSLAKVLCSKTLKGFPQNLSTCYIDPFQTSTFADLTPSEFLLKLVESRCDELKAQITQLEMELGEEKTDDIEAIADRLSALYEQEEQLTASAHEEIQRTLGELGFEAANLLERRVCDLSSGWRYKCQLASALLSHAELLVLDEPSFLDSASMAWLVERVRGVVRRGSIVCLISHKETLLTQLVDRVWFINAAKHLETYNCGYEQFKIAVERNVGHTQAQVEIGEMKQAKASTALNKTQQRLAKSERKNAKKIAGGEDRRFIKGKAVEAKQKGDRSQAARLRQMKKKVEHLKELEKSAKQHQVCPLHLEGNTESEDQQLVTIQDASFDYIPGVTVLKEVSLAIYGADRVALVGPNGAGKSTLINLLLKRIEPVTGSIHHTRGLRVAYFPQNALQELIEQYGDLSATELLQMDRDSPAVTIRVELGRYGLKGDLCTQRIKTLSAGQRTRLYLAREFLSKSKPSLLVLDEVENLDAETAQSLMEGIAAFRGAVLCVSHNESSVIQFKPRQIWTISHGKVQVNLTDNFVREVDNG